MATSILGCISVQRLQALKGADIGPGAIPGLGTEPPSGKRRIEQRAQAQVRARHHALDEGATKQPDAGPGQPWRLRAREAARGIDTARTRFSTSFGRGLDYYTGFEFELHGKGNGTEALANVTAMTGDLRVIVAGLRQGKGTVGALLVDPSVYEDMKLVLGNVERNDVLRALVRYSIKQDEKKPAVTVGKTP